MKNFRFCFDLKNDALCGNMVFEKVCYLSMIVEGCEKMDQAVLSSRDGFTVFQFGKHTIRFRAPYSLEQYTSVKEWDNGYIVAMAKYAHNPQPEEEYIDLVPILKDLYIDTEAFLSPIKGVTVSYE